MTVSCLVSTCSTMLTVGVSSPGSQLVTVQNTGLVMPDVKVQVRVSVRPGGPGNAVRPNKVSPFNN